jgi:hypothetical protein
MNIYTHFSFSEQCPDIFTAKCLIKITENFLETWQEIDNACLYETLPLSTDRSHWWTPVNMVTNLWVPWKIVILHYPNEMAINTCTALIRLKYSKLYWIQGIRRNCLSQQLFSRCLLHLYFDRYMFRPLLAIIKWNTQYNIWRSYYSYNGSIACCTNCTVHAIWQMLSRLFKGDCGVSTCACNHFAFYNIDRKSVV